MLAAMERSRRAAAINAVVKSSVMTVAQIALSGRRRLAKGIRSATDAAVR